MLTKDEMDKVYEKWTPLLPSSMYKDGHLYITKEELANILEKISQWFPIENGFGEDPYAQMHPAAECLLLLAEQIYTGRIRITNFE